MAEGEPWVPDGLLDVGIYYEGEGHIKEGDSEVSDFNQGGDGAIHRDSVNRRSMFRLGAGKDG